MDKFLTKLENEFDTIVHHLSTSNIFRNIISDIKTNETVRTDHRLLLRYLKLNYLLITKGKSSNFQYDFKPDEIDADLVYEIALFVFLNGGGANEPVCNDPLVRLDVIEAVIDYSALTNTDCDRGRIETFLTSQVSGNVKKTCNVIEKYMKANPSRGGFLEEVSETVSPEALIEIVCCLGGIFVPRSVTFWETVPALLVHGSFTEKKKGVYVLRKAVERGGLLAGSAEAWENFFRITEATSEKQYHLVQPTFKFVETLGTLEITWRTCVTSRYLTHPHKDIVRFTVKKILNNEWPYDVNLLAKALNKVYIYDTDPKIEHDLKTFLENATTDDFVKFTKSFSEFCSNPIAIFIIVNSMTGKRLDGNVYETVSKTVSKIPHVFLRHASKLALARYDSHDEYFDLRNVPPETSVHTLQNRLRSQPTEVLEDLMRCYYDSEMYVPFLVTWTVLYRNGHRLQTFPKLTDALQRTKSLNEVPNPVKVALIMTEASRIVDRLNEAFDTENDIVCDIIDACLTTVLPKRLYDDAALNSLLNRCIDDLFSKGAGAILSSDVIALLLRPEVVTSDVLNGTVSRFIRKVSKTRDVYDDFSQVRCKFFEQLSEADDVVKSFAAENLLEYVLEALLNVVLFRKSQRFEHKLCVRIRDESETSFRTELPCLSDERTRMYALEITFRIIRNVPKTIPEIFRALFEKYHSTFQKRYFKNSQIHLLKLRILQFFFVAFESFDEFHEKHLDGFFEALTVEAHQPSVKILLQWLVSKIIVKRGRSDDELRRLLVVTADLKGQSVTNVFPVLYHVSRQCSEGVVVELLKFLAEQAMGACFSTRYLAQLTFKFVFEFHQIEALRLQYEVVSGVLRQTNTPQSHDPFNLAFLDVASYFTIETVYHDLPRLTGVQRIDCVNDFNFIDIPDCEKLNASDHLRKLTPKRVPQIADEPGEEAFTNVQRKIETWDSPVESSKGELVVVASLIDRVPNLGGLSRTCEVFGVRRYVLGNGAIVKSNEYRNLSMSSEKWVEIEEVRGEGLGEYLRGMKRRGYCIVGAEQTAESQKLDEYEFAKKTVLVLGNEKEGIPANLLHLMDVCLEIPQLGQIRSLNVHVAGALFIWEYTKQLVIEKPKEITS